MAKFINKKEQVYDLKLTSYGHHLLSIGEFDPTYYAFFDDNVIYDNSYTITPTRGIYDLSIPWQDGCSVYEAAPGPLQGWWRLNTNISVTGSAIDSSGKGRAGTFDNVGDKFLRPKFSTARNPPLIQTGSCNFDADNDAINIGSAALWNGIIGNDTGPDMGTDGAAGSGGTTLATGSNQQMTFAAWVYKTGEGGGNYGRILDFGDSDLALYSTAAERLYFVAKWNGNNNVYWRTATGVFSEDTWTHVVVTYDATAAANDPIIYVNGSDASAAHYSGTKTGTYYGIVSQAGFIGNRYGADRAFEGNLADVAIWNKVLTPTEVSLIYNASQGTASACSAWAENQNNVDNRIKNETQYLESLVLFEDIDDALAGTAGENIDPLSDELTWVQRLPRKDIFKINAMIGDAYLDGKTNAAPAWKVAALQSTISSSQEQDELNQIEIPQLNIVANYRKKIVESTFEFDPSSVRNLHDQTSAFIDDKRIVLEARDPLFYVEEVNTELLTENFDVAVFTYVTSGSNLANASTGSQEDKLERKFFRREIPQIVDGFLVSDVKETVVAEEITTGSVEYYFDVLADQNIQQELACEGAALFNKGSYYIDLDFECDTTEEENVFFDIYGSTTEPEICQD
jgi:hypothetical protein